MRKRQAAPALIAAIPAMASGKPNRQPPIAIAAANVWALFIPWLSLLGILVPPIGAILIVDLYFVRPGATIDADWRPKPFIAWVIGSVIAFIVETKAPGLSTALSAFLVGGIAYFILTMSERSSSPMRKPA